MKSKTKKPSSGWPSTTTVFFRLANSGWSATFVVAMMFGSCRATKTPSFVETRSGSM